MSDNIKVVVKVRPLISREVEDKQNCRWRVKNNTLVQLDQNGRETDICFTFDKVYDKETKTNEVYKDIAKPVVEGAVAGFNGTIFAYGQTSSGKTYTMTGTNESPGIIPLAVLNLFELIKKVPNRDFLVRVSYIEIYNETLKDLLNVEKKIKVHDSLQGVRVDATEKVTASPEEVLEVMKQGEVNRQTGLTNMNEESSRSHSIFQITIESREHMEGEEEESGCVNVSQLNLVDLAGSERAGQTGATGIRFKEGTHINKSLSALALVIKQLSEDPNKYANYRDSKLTRILQNSLGGNAKTSIICAITPASVEETISTLQFANRAKAIKNKPSVNAVATSATMIQGLTKQLCKLQAELASKKNLELMLENRKNVEQELQGQIQTLQKLILNGFVHRSEIRKPAASLRRKTISALHHIEEEPEVSRIPKFCTPSLKYNPLNLGGPSEFLPIQSAMSLSSVPEEARMITPPPTKTVGFNDEVIQLDSDDDDDDSSQPPCSPYHKCYGSSKTPPCVLRKHAKQAEKNLKDIVELTEREKMYTPSVVELMEKLESKTNVVTQLMEEIASLQDDRKKKDIHIEELSQKINKTEEEVKKVHTNKLELEAKCREFNTKITDWEVSYETLVKKFKNREEELLSLLAEKKVEKTEEIGKIPKGMEKDLLNLMDLSKDISLVNSEDESSTTLIKDEDGSSQMHELVSNMKTELTKKNQFITDLEDDLLSQKQKIETLEISTQVLQSKIDEIQNKLSNTETENTFLKSSIDTLNSTVESQKQNLEIANKDIDSYNKAIKELQIRLVKKDNILNVQINDSIIEDMISSEETFIANNDNIKNIINSLKIALSNKNKDVEALNSAIEKQEELISENLVLKSHMEERDQQVLELIAEADKLKNQLKENTSMIEKLIKNEHDLKSQLTTAQEQNRMFEKQNHECETKISDLIIHNSDFELKLDQLQNDNESLTLAISEKETNVQNLFGTNQQLSIQIQEATQIISDLRSDLNAKELVISSGDNVTLEMQSHITKCKSILQKIYDCEYKFTGVSHTMPETTDFENIAMEIDSKLKSIEKAIDMNVQAASDLQIQLSTLEKTRREEVTNVKAEIESLNGEMLQQTTKLSQQLIELSNELERNRENLNKKNEEISTKETELNALREEVANFNLVISQRTAESSAAITESKLQLEQAREEVKNKDQLLLDLNAKLAEVVSNEKKICSVINKIKEMFYKVNRILANINGSSVEPQETEIEDILDSCDNKINDLEHAINHMLQASYELQSQLVALKNSHQNEVASFQTRIEELGTESQSQIASLLEQHNSHSDTINKTRAEMETKNQYIEKLNTKLNDANENIENLRNDLKSKETTISLLNEDVSKLRSELKSQNIDTEIDIIKSELIATRETYEKMLNEKTLLITILEEKAAAITKDVENRYEEMTSILKDTVGNAKSLIMEVLEKTCKLIDEDLFTVEDIQDISTEHVYEKIIVNLDKISDYITLLKTENDIERCDIEKMLSIAKRELENVSENNLKLRNDNEEINIKNAQLISELDDIKKLNKELLEANVLLQNANGELQSNSNEIIAIEEKMREEREYFNNYEKVVNQKYEELMSENIKLRESNDSQNNSLSGPSLYSGPKLNEIVIPDTPQSLTTICCNKIINYLQPDETDFKSVTTASKCSMPVEHSESQTIYKCGCDELKIEFNRTTENNVKLVQELEKVTSENLRLVEHSKELEETNHVLLIERQEVQREIQALSEPAIELQKKIAKHKTNLSTLTATTYAENKLLNSQLKVLKHHHTRYIHVCQRDLPAFKTQLNELMTILKDSTLVTDKQNASFKRYSLPDVLDSNTTMSSTFKNESTLDGDLLMLDTNVSMTTADNTLVGPDQTYLEITQVNFDTEVACQTNDLSEIDPCLMYAQMETITNENQKLMEEIVSLKTVNGNLREEINNFKPAYKDAQNSPFKINGNNHMSACQYCEEKAKELRTIEERLYHELKVLADELDQIRSEKDSFEEKYTNLTLEIPSSDALIQKLSNAEKEIGKLNNDLIKKKKIIEELQTENDTLSNQVMDNISEADELKKELDALRDTTVQLKNKCESLQEVEKMARLNNDIVCHQCAMKDECIKKLQLEHSKLNRSLSDSDTSSRHNTICTLQNELHASKEDCKKITEEFATIKDHLERSNISINRAMDLDDSMGESNILTITKDIPRDNRKSQVHNYGEKISDIYITEKNDCFKFYVEKIGTGKENINENTKIIDVMKMFYTNVVAQHGTEVEDLLNNLNEFQKSKDDLQKQLNNAIFEYTEVKKELDTSRNNVKTLNSILHKIRENITLIDQEITRVDDNSHADKNSKLVTLFKENILKVLDYEFGLTSVNIYESLIDSIINKHHTDLANAMEQYTKLQTHMESVVTEFNTVNDNLNQMKSQLTNKENEYNLIKAQKERIHEISNAVTLDIVKKEQDLTEIFTKGYQKLTELGIIKPCDNISLSLIENIRQLFDQLANIRHSEVSSDNNDKQLLIESVNTLKSELVVKEKALSVLERRLTDQENNIKEQRNEMITQLVNAKQEYEGLKSVNDMIVKEKETYATELEKAQNVIAINKLELEKMTSDILVLRESVSDNVSIIQTLTLESKSLLEQNLQLKKDVEAKTKECLRLEMNIKTHEKSVEIQSKMIIRLQKQKEEDDALLKEKDKQLEEKREEVEVLQKQLDTAKEELESLRDKKIDLEHRISQLELDSSDGSKHKKSIDPKADNTRRRRQSLHDSKRVFIEGQTDLDQQKIEAVFESRAKPDDLFMDVDDHSSGRSTPNRLSRGRDSLNSPLRDDDSRPSSVLRAKHRRQSLHDQHRSSLPSSSPLCDSSKPLSSGDTNDVTKLRNALTACQQELEELKERYKELDEECETCAQYLREREERCSKLKKEKVALEKQVAELRSGVVSKATCNAAVNTDEDWANLHSVVVDRMSFDAEVEKNKKLIRTIEELRCNKQDLKTTIAKMQKALEKNAGYSDSKELELAKSELAACKQELEELQGRYKELDEECETCAQYLRERDEQCRKLREAKQALEVRLQECQSGDQVARRKRHSAHDKQRAHAHTDTSDDLISYQVEKDDNTLRENTSHAQELNRMKAVVDKLKKDKMALEHQLTATKPTMYVATGSAIVQNQQLTDVMTENQKLKRINAKLISICKKRGKVPASENKEGEDSELG